MADDDQFQHGSSGNNWWDITTTRSRFEKTHNETSSSQQQASTISTTLNAIANNYGHWPSQIVHRRSRSSSMDPSLTAISSRNTDHHDSGVVLANLNSHMMGLGLMSDGTQNMDWSHNSLFRGEESDESSFRQENEASSSIRFRSSSEDIKSSSVNESKHINPLGFSLDRSRFTSQETISNDDSSSKIPSQNLTNSYHQHQQLDSSAAYGLLLPENPRQASYDDLYNQYGSTPEPLVSSSCNKYYQNLLRASPPKKQSQFTNSTPLWNSPSSRAMDCNNDPRRSSYFFPMQNNNNNAPAVVVPSFDERPKMNSETKKKNNTAETSNKRPRSDQTTSSFPPFKRKEKMGDRINALQQLVSPFGKTDTASVLSEAIQYIKFLHEQVGVLCTPYIKNGNLTQHHQQYSDILNDLEGPRQDLRSRGLCLVPISSTFPVTHETTVDFWTPTTFERTFR